MGFILQNYSINSVQRLQPLSSVVPILIFVYVFVLGTTQRDVEIKINLYEAYNVRRNGLSGFQDLKMADYHGRNVQS